jgi:hypothetical protein
MRVPEEPVFIYLFRQNSVFISLYFKSPVLLSAQGTSPEALRNLSRKKTCILKILQCVRLTVRVINGTLSRDPMDDVVPAAVPRPHEVQHPDLIYRYLSNNNFLKENFVIVSIFDYTEFLRI